MSDKNIILIKSKKYAVKIINFKNILKDRKEYELASQVLRSGTSIGSNVKEGVQAQSKADFISKLSIALKEASETEYWLEIFHESNLITTEEFSYMIEDCRELIKILTAIIKSSKSNSK